ncbi:hypothetical protein [Bacteriovorax sp. Seq25_V]|uniref:hypothetical protein n=1 Tax=Bacteriovorax sp. Seq25_V TaxID=1201288 RepID=UPI000389F582|nr:hypothetical protein [Bacteriovorax sp. Seq25_V]EQC43515.1 hypothetical protein M900_2784 [Bacteriovorax sp. Seq25_V]
MKATNLIQKATLAAFVSGSFMVFGGIYQSMKVTDTSYMKDSEIKFSKRLDESKDRVVASAVKKQKAIHYLPVNEFNSATINGKWEIIRIEDENGETVLDINDGDKARIVNFELFRTSQIRINDNNKYLFDISFLHEAGNNIAIFRSYGKGYELIEARRVNKAVVATSEVVESEEVKAEEVYTEQEGLVDLTLERAMIPTLGSTVIVGSDFVNGEVAIGNKAVQGLSFSVSNKEGKEVSFAISDIQLQDAGNFTVEVDGQESTGLVTNNGKDSYRIRFATGPLQGALLNFVTDSEMDRLREEAYQVERLKEEREAEVDSVKVTEVTNQQEAAVSERKNANSIDASYKAQVEEEVEAELREQIEEEYQVESIEGEENFVTEVSRQGFSF